MTKNLDTPIYKCSFCGNEESDVTTVIKGPGVHICEDCVMICADLTNNEIIKKTQAGADILNDSNLTKPSDIKEYLDKHVIGQEQAKKILSVAVFNHYKKIQNNLIEGAPVIEKSNIVICGPTGSGKTHLAKTLAQTLDIPFATSDATSLTESGYVGDDVENVLLRLLQAADYDVEKAQKGIIYIDEIDKISRKGSGPSLNRDVSGEGVQQALLRIIEGTVSNVPVKPGRKNPTQDMIQIDTSNILFIVGGAFEGIDKIIKRRMTSNTLGFKTNDLEVNEEVNEENYHNYITFEDLTSFGIIPELAGRLPILAPLSKLDEEALVNILTGPENSIIKQFQRLLEQDEIILEFEHDALLGIAKIALENKTGARGLRTILEDKLLDLFYTLPSLENIRSVSVTASYVKTKEFDDLNIVYNKNKEIV